MALEIPVYVLVFLSCSCDSDEGTFQTAATAAVSETSLSNVKGI